LGLKEINDISDHQLCELGVQTNLLPSGDPSKKIQISVLKMKKVKFFKADFMNDFVLSMV